MNENSTVFCMISWLIQWYNFKLQFPFFILFFYFSKLRMLGVLPRRPDKLNASWEGTVARYKSQLLWSMVFLVIRSEKLVFRKNSISKCMFVCGWMDVCVCLLKWLKKHLLRVIVHIIYIILYYTCISVTVYSYIILQ